MADDIKIGLGADISDFIKAVDSARDKIRSFGKAVSQSLPDTDNFRRLQQQLAKEGIRTTSSIEAQILQLKNLQRAFGADAVAAAEIEKRLASLNNELRQANQAVKATIAPFDAFANAQRTLARLGIESEKAIKSQVRQLESLRKRFKDDAVVVAQLDARIESLNLKMGGRGLSGNTSQAVTTLTNFNRVVQDAPFGILGIANNIDPLLESFLRLRTSSGTTGAALKALGSSFLGPTGILFAVSAATSAFLAFGSTSKGALDGAKDAAEDAGEALKSAASSILNIEKEDISVTISKRDNILTAVEEARRELKQFRTEEARANENLRAVAQGRSEEAVRYRLAAAEAAETQVKEQEVFLKLLEDELIQYDALIRARQKLRGVGGSVDPNVPELGPSIPRPKTLSAFDRDNEKFSRIKTPDLTGLVGEEKESDLDKNIIRIANFRKAVEVGVIPASQAARQEIALLQQQLLILIENGVDPLSLDFLEMVGRLDAMRAELEETEGVVQEGAVAFALFGNVAASALEEIIFKARSLKDILGGVARQLVGTLLRAGINVGIGALTGNPLSFGAAIGNLVGLPNVAGINAAVPEIGKGGIVVTGELVGRGNQLVAVINNETESRGGGILR